MYQTAPPPEHLKSYIDCFWTGELQHPAGAAVTHHAIASSKLELQFHYTGHYVTTDPSGQCRQVFKAGFFGQGDRFRYYVPGSGRTGIFSVRFQPLALAVLFDTPGYLLTNESYEINSVLGKDGSAWAEQVLEAPSFEQRIGVIVKHVEKRLASARFRYFRLEKLIAELEHSPGPVSLEKLTAAACLSPRQFERTFRELTGFSARNYLKLIRFEKAVVALSRAKHPAKRKLTDIALDFGYYDQAHFNRHFRDYTGTTPTRYFRHISSQED
jgi:AraC-like DNA-binding protein